MLVAFKSFEDCQNNQVRTLKFDVSLMLNCTELKTWIFCHQFHFYGRPPKNLHPFNSRFLNCPANYGCSHGLKGHMGVFSANRDISARVKLLHYLDIAPFPSCPSPWVWVSSSGNPEASPSDLWISDPQERKEQIKRREFWNKFRLFPPGVKS